MKMNIQIPKSLIQLRWARGLITASCLVFLFLGDGCRSVIPNKIYHCYDEQGKPLEGVLFVCKYGLANEPAHRLDYRFSNREGIVRFQPDVISGDSAGLMRSMLAVYSYRMHSGMLKTGDQYMEGSSPVPDAQVYSPNFTDNIFFMDCNNNPAKWFDSLNIFLYLARDIQLNNYGIKDPSITALKQMIVPFAKKERAAFIEKYGEEIAPVNSTTTAAARTLRDFYGSKYITPGVNINRLNEFITSPSKNTDVKFKDITIYIP